MARARSAQTAAAASDAKPSQCVAGQRGPVAVGEEEQRVVGAGVAFDADAVERLLGRLRATLWQVAGDDRGVGAARKPSMVAMFGPIMAAPLAKPVSRTSGPSRPAATRVTTLMRVSVVRMAWAASIQAGGCRLRAVGRGRDAAFDVGPSAAAGR